MFDLNDDTFLVSLTNYFLKNFSDLNWNGHAFSFNLAFNKGINVETGREGQSSNSMWINDRLDVMFNMTDESKIMLQLLSEIGACDINSINRISSLALRSINLSDICKDFNNVRMEIKKDDNIKINSICIQLRGQAVEKPIDFLILRQSKSDNATYLAHSEISQTIDHGEITWVP